MKKLILISIDGFRFDLVNKEYCPFVHSYALNGLFLKIRSVIPPITLPCFCSIFYSVKPETHGIFYNIIPNEFKIPYPNLFEILYQNNLKSAVFFNWETLKRSFGDLKNIQFCFFENDLTIKGDKALIKEANQYIKKDNPDFVFIYIGSLDEIGHDYGWMSSEYLKIAKEIDNLIANFIKEVGIDYSYIIHSDHGGIENGHYVKLREVLEVPFIYLNFEKKFLKSKEINKSIIDIAPTILKYFNILIPKEWEGKSIF